MSVLVAHLNIPSSIAHPRNAVPLSPSKKRSGHRLLQNGLGISKVLIFTDALKYCVGWQKESSLAIVRRSTALLAGTMTGYSSISYGCTLRARNPLTHKRSRKQDGSTSLRVKSTGRVKNNLDRRSIGGWIGQVVPIQFTSNSLIAYLPAT